MTYGDIEIKICKFHYSKCLINIKNVDSNKIIISKRLSYYVYCFQE